MAIIFDRVSQAHFRLGNGLLRVIEHSPSPKYEQFARTYLRIADPIFGALKAEDVQSFLPEDQVLRFAAGLDSSLEEQLALQDWSHVMSTSYVALSGARELATALPRRRPNLFRFRLGVSALPGIPIWVSDDD